MRLGARIARLAAGLLAVGLAAFALPARVAGGTEAAFLGARAHDPIARSELRHHLHLSSSPPARFVHFVADATHGDLGYSPVGGVDVGPVVGERTLESAALTAAAVGVALLVSRRRRLGRRRIRAPDAPAPSAVPGALWTLSLFGAVAVAWRFGAIPVGDPHAAIVTRVGASVLPAIALGVALAVWTAAARRTARDVLAALIVGTLVTDALFGLPGLGTLLRDATTRPDPLMLRGVVLAVGSIAVVGAVVFVPVVTTDDLTGGRSTRRRTASGLAAALWLLALVAAVVGRLYLDLAPAGRIGTDVGSGVTASHPFGTDVVGRDVLARVLATARGSLLLIVATMLVATVLGTVVGVVVGFTDRRAEHVGRLLLAGWAAFPGEIVAVALLAFNGRDGKGAAVALAFVAAPNIAAGAQRHIAEAVRRSDARLSTGAWLRSVGSGNAPGLVPAALATMFVGAARVLVAEIAVGLLGVGPAASQTWSHEIASQLQFASGAPLAVLAPASVALVTAVALAGLGNAIRPVRVGESASGESEDPLREDVLVHLGGAAGDGERA